VAGGTLVLDRRPRRAPMVLAWARVGERLVAEVRPAAPGPA
jgi:hypothetical protein